MFLSMPFGWFEQVLENPTWQHVGLAGAAVLALALVLHFVVIIGDRLFGSAPHVKPSKIRTEEDLCEGVYEIVHDPRYVILRDENSAVWLFYLKRTLPPGNMIRVSTGLNGEGLHIFPYSLDKPTI